jgi:ethylmalonyl-CoA/methylmalonyl-CoA decarboxylase
MAGDLAAAIAGLRSWAPRGARASGHVRLTLNGPLAELVVDHAERKNALSLGMMVELAEAVDELTRWPGQGLLLRAATPGVFCAGGDLTELPGAPPEAIAAMAVAMTCVLDTIADSPWVSACWIDGLAVGGGAELLTATDFRVAGPAAEVHFVQARLGIAPGWGGAGRLVRAIGPKAALRVLLESRRFDRDEGLRVGLFDAAATSVDDARRWLEMLLAAPSAATRAVKRQVVAASPARGGDPARESAAFVEVWGGPAHQEAMERLERHRR